MISASPNVTATCRYAVELSRHGSSLVSAKFQSHPPRPQFGYLGLISLRRYIPRSCHDLRPGLSRLRTLAMLVSAQGVAVPVDRGARPAHEPLTELS